MEIAALLLRRLITDRRAVLVQVETELRSALKLNASDYDACYQLGRLAMFKGDPSLAKNCFQRVVELRPNHVKARQELKKLTDRKSSQSTRTP